MSATGKTFVNLSSSPAFGYAVLGIVVIVAFKVIHDSLKQDVKDTTDKLSHPFGQAFDDTFQRGVNWLFGLDPNTGFSDENGNPAPPTTYPVPKDFGLVGDTSTWD